MKLQGPFAVGIYKGVPVLLDSACRQLLRSQWSTGDFDDDHDTVKRLAAALNRDEARKATPTYSGWDGIVSAGGRLAIQFDGRGVDDITVINLLNKLGVTLPNRRPARKGSR